MRSKEKNREDFTVSLGFIFTESMSDSFNQSLESIHTTIAIRCYWHIADAEFELLA